MNHGHTHTLGVDLGLYKSYLAIVTPGQPARVVEVVGAAAGGLPHRPGGGGGAHPAAPQGAHGLGELPGPAAAGAPGERGDGPGGGRLRIAQRVGRPACTARRERWKRPSTRSFGPGGSSSPAGEHVGQRTWENSSATWKRSRGCWRKARGRPGCGSRTWTTWGRPSPPGGIFRSARPS
jgi:hypothetical protein